MGRIEAQENLGKVHFMKPLERQAGRDYNANMNHDIDTANAQRE